MVRWAGLPVMRLRRGVSILLYDERANHGRSATEMRYDTMNEADTGDSAIGTDTHRTCEQCPLHFTMQRLARAAVSQLVYYADGEYVPRANLLDDLERWQSLHALVATRICPASRRTSSAEDDLHAAQALVPEAQFT